MTTVTTEQAVSSAVITMTHEEIVKEFREIGKYLQSKEKGIKARYGEKPEFGNEMDEWHFELLMQVCKTIEEPRSTRPYIRVNVPDMNYAPSAYAIKI